MFSYLQRGLWEKMSIDTNLKAIKAVLGDPNLLFVCLQLLTFRFDSSVKSFPTEFLHIRREAFGNDDTLFWERVLRAVTRGEGFWMEVCSLTSFSSVRTMKTRQRNKYQMIQRAQTPA